MNETEDRIEPSPTENSGERRNTLAEVGGLFLKFGAFGFGGPPAHLAMMEAECVGTRQWVTAQEFAEGLAVCNLLPGPTSTQMALWLGYKRAGTFGSCVAGFGFILPAFLMLLVLTWGYFRYGTLPGATGLFEGIRPAVIAVLLMTCWRLGKAAVKDAFGGVLLVLAFVLTLFHVEAALTLLAAGVLGLLRARIPIKPPKTAVAWLPAFVAFSLDDRLVTLGVFFFRVGALLFGGGLVSLPLIQREVVNGRGWLTTQEFLDGVALGQITPGPVIITATFIGYKVAKWSGAVVATVAIFLPSYLLILLAAPQLERIRKFPSAQAFLKGVAPAVVGTILAACVPLAAAVLASVPQARLWFPLLVFVLALTVLLRTKIGVPWIVVSAGLLGLLRNLL